MSGTRPNNRRSKKSLSINGYLDTCLAPSLAARGVDRLACELVSHDVGQRLASLLRYGDALSYLGPLLLTGLEEAKYYEPLDVPLAVRSLVVVAVRNSLLEDLTTDVPFTEELKPFRQSVPDDQVPNITRSAAEYFANADLADLASEVRNGNSADWFGELPAKHPYAWRALSRASAVMSNVTIPSPEVSLAPLPAATNSASPIETDIQSGIDPRFSPRLLDALQLIQDHEVEVFFADSFKGVTRNLSKLCQVIDIVLAHGAVFLTHNYYLSLDYVASRDGLLRPMHSGPDTAKFRNGAGLTRQHHEALMEIR